MRIEFWEGVGGLLFWLVGQPGVWLLVGVCVWGLELLGLCLG